MLKGQGTQAGSCANLLPASQCDDFAAHNGFSFFLAADIHPPGLKITRH